MARPARICLVGASGLIGTALLRASAVRSDVRIVAVARRELALPPGARLEVLVADPANWGDAIAAARPDTVVSCLGTTWKKAGEDESAFRAVDQDLVLDCARWGLEAGAHQFIMVSSVGAALHAKALYLRVKAEAERALAKLGYPRLDVLQPGLLRGARAEYRPAERIGQIVAPVADLFLRGGLSRYRSVGADWLADVILALAHEKARGRFIHEHEAMARALKRQAYHASIGQGAAVVE